MKPCQTPPLTSKWQSFFFGPKAPWYLSLAAALLLLGWLNGHPIWTQEYRWQQICLHMLHSGDYFHPYLDGRPYYDKPLLSYWLMLLISQLGFGLHLTALRLPSVLAAGSVLYSVFYIGRFWFTRETGLLAAWLLLTTFYFVFWARVASTDMLNVAVILGAIAWIFSQADHLAQSRHQLVLLLLLALGALLKGLIAPVLVIMVMLPWFCQQRRYRAFCQWRSVLWAGLALAVYLSPFIASSFIHHDAYAENGLLEVFHENIVRFFHPFDHQGGIQTYFIYAPIYVLPWTPLWLLALYRYLPTWRQQNPGVQWLNWASCSIFIFLSLSGSRRSYYILPIIPFAILQIAYTWQQCPPKTTLLAWLAGAYAVLWIYFVVFQPCYYLQHGL